MKIQSCYFINLNKEENFMKLKKISIMSLAALLSLNCQVATAAGPECIVGKPAGQGSGGPTSGDLLTAAPFITTAVVLSVPGTVLMATSSLYCTLFDNASVTKIMIEREATLLKEKGELFQPSFLGGYAEYKGVDIYQAAEDVLTNGVQ